jgi:cell division protein FtsQ
MKKVKKIAIALLLLAYLGVTIGFISERRSRLVCNSLKISIPDSLKHSFVRQKDILNLLQAQGVNWIGQYISQINTQQMESLVYKHPAIKEARVYKTIAGSINIEVLQRQPLLRIINRYGDTYYVDEDGKAMPWSNHFTARVLVANGNIGNRFDFSRYREANILNDTITSYHTLKDLFLLASYIQDNKFWRAHFEEIYVEENGDFELIPRVGGHLIIFGKIENMEEKLSNLQQLYTLGLPNEGWNKYSIINLKFKNQVVCTKK